MTETELNAWNGLIAGKLEPLASVLDTDNGYLHPILQRWLLKLINGTPDETDFRLAVDRHPDLRRASDGRRAKRIAGLPALRTALKMTKNGALDGCWESALSKTLSESPEGRSTIIDRWSKEKEFIEFLRAHGIFKN